MNKAAPGKLAESSSSVITPDFTRRIMTQEETILTKIKEVVIMVTITEIVVIIFAVFFDMVPVF